MPKKATPTVQSLQRQIDALQAQLKAATPPPADETSLTELRRRLKEHRLAMRQTPGGIISLEDERTEMLLVRAIELAKAPESARTGQQDLLERSDGLTNAGLTAGEDDDDVG